MANAANAERLTDESPGPSCAPPKTGSGRKYLSNGRPDFAVAKRWLHGQPNYDNLTVLPEHGLTPMKIDERALLQERVRTLVLRHALQAVLDRLAVATRGAGQDAESELL